MTFKLPTATTVVMVDKGAWTTGAATAVNNIWTFTPAGATPQRWVDTVGGGVLPASPTAGNTTTPGRYVEEGEINTNGLFAPVWVTTSTKTAAYTANPNEKVPCDTSGGTFAVTLPAAVLSGTTTPTRVQVVGVAASGTNAVTFVLNGSDTFTLPASALPLTVLPGENIDLQCIVAGKWSVV